MTQWQQIDTDRIPGGAELTFHRRNDEFMIRADGLELMTSTTSGSERQIVHEALSHVDAKKVRSVLIGGLGLGFTLAEACRTLPDNCQIITVEISPKVKEWVTTHMAGVTGTFLRDPRVTLRIADLTSYLHATNERFDLILSDIDNGPHAFVLPTNDRLYDVSGLKCVYDRLTPEGCVVFWSGSNEPAFCRDLEMVFPVIKTHTYTLPQAPNIEQYLFAAYKTAQSAQ